MNRLPWEIDPQTQRGFIAYPQGEGTAPFARIDYSSTRLSEKGWEWWVYWPGRFQDHGVAGNKQDAADRATAGWWASIELTSEWDRPVDPKIPAAIADIPSLTDDELTTLIERYRLAIAYGNVPSIESDGKRDQMVYSEAWAERKRRGWSPEDRAGKQPI